MKTHSISTLIPVLLTFMAGSTFAFAEAKPGEKPAPQPREKAVKNPEGWPVLKKGTLAEDVKRLIGKPDSIRTMESNEGKAEVWVYRRLAKSITHQTAATTETISAYMGVGGMGNDSIGTTTIPSYRMERIEVYQVSSLLMLDGKLQAATQRAETERHFE